MTDSKDLEAEIHPLKSENRKVPENTGGPAGKEPRGTPAPQTRLSRCRTAAFFLSLFACLLVVFVVSFIIPCPDRPASQGVWRIDYNAAGVGGGGAKGPWVPWSLGNGSALRMVGGVRQRKGPFGYLKDISTREHLKNRCREGHPKGENQAAGLLLAS